MVSSISRSTVCGAAVPYATRLFKTTIGPKLGVGLAPDFQSSLSVHRNLLDRMSHEDHEVHVGLDSPHEGRAHVSQAP
jgi:hypothetical protein